MKPLVALDQWLFLKVNQGLAYEPLDPIFLFFSDIHRNKIFMLGVVLLLIGSLIAKFKKRFWLPLLYIILSVSLSDLLCYRVVKNVVDRERPFQSEAFKTEVRKVGHGHGRSFPSNHAANSFAGASALSFLFPHLSLFFYAYAFFVALSRVYVGVHYPFDVICGALIGLFVALSIRKLFRNQLKSCTGRKA